MTRRSHTNTHGATLVETIVYMALFAIVSLVIVSSLIVSFRVFSEIRMSRAMVQTMTSGFDRVLHELYMAEAILPGSVTGTHPGSVVFQVRTSDGDEIERRIFVDNGRLMLEEEGLVVGPLSHRRVSVERFIVRYTTADPEENEGSPSTFVWFDVGLSASMAGRTASHDTSFGVVMRGSY